LLELVVRALDLHLRRLRVRLPAMCFQVTTLGKLFTHVPLSPSSIIWYRSKGGATEKVTVRLDTMRHTLQWFIHLQTQGLSKEDEQPAYTPH